MNVRRNYDRDNEWHIRYVTVRIESIKTTSMEMLKNKEQYLSSKDIAEKIYDLSRHIYFQMSKYKKMKIYNPLCQTYSPTVG